MKNLNQNLKKERKVMDAKVSYSVLLGHIRDNFLYGFLNGIVIAFVAMFVNETNTKSFILLVISYYFLKKVESKVFNREKYTSKLGKQYIYPIPATVGFVFGAYCSTLI